MAFEISKPSSQQGSGFRPSDFVGALVVFIGCHLEPEVNTAYGKTSAARVDIAVPLDGEDAGEVFKDSLIFGKVLVPSLTNADGDIVVGRIAKGDAKPGQNAPYILEDPSKKEEKAVLEWLEENIEETERGAYEVIDKF